MEVCDRVAGDPNGAKDAVQSMIKRLAHRNANVQLYTLEVSCCPRRRSDHKPVLPTLSLGCKCALPELRQVNAPRAV
jgi:hypothetical protein